MVGPKWISLLPRVTLWTLGSLRSCGTSRAGLASTSRGSLRTLWAGRSRLPLCAYTTLFATESVTFAPAARARSVVSTSSGVFVETCLSFR